MSVRYVVAVVAAAFVFGSTSTVVAAGNETRLSAVAGARPGGPGGNAAEQFADLPRQAPVGHRQPRASDAPENTELSPMELELRRLDEEIDRKLIICRGC